MNIREISDIFKDTADNITAIKSYNFGWASDRVRQGNTEDFQELNEFPRVFFSVPTITGSDQTRKQDTYQVTLFFDDLLGYDNEGDEDPTLQIDKWANLQQYANYFVQRLNKIKQSILPNYLFIPEAPSITFDSFTGLQRMITVQLSFNLVVPTNCDPGIITLVQCIANIVTSSNLTASLTTVLKFAASLEGRATVTADINFVQKVASSLNANALLSGDINFVQKAQASLLTSASVTGNITIPKTFNASLLATGTTTANLTVQSGFDADAQAFINAAAITDATQKSAINTLVTSLKSNELWTKMKAIYPFIGGTASTHKFNLKDPRDLNAAYRIVFSGGWTHNNINGITPNGINAAGDTFYLGSGVDNNFALSYYTKTNIMQPNTPGLYTFGGSTNSLTTYAIIINRTNANLASTMGRETSVALKDYNNVAQVGLFTGSRTSSSLNKVYKNNVLENTNTVEQAGSWGTRNVFFGQPSLLAYTTMSCQFASISEGLTDTDVVNLYSIVQAYQITLNRQV
jgi:hypothetical protein